MMKKYFGLLIILLAGYQCTENGVDNNDNKGPMKVLWEHKYDKIGLFINAIPLVLGDSLVIMDGGKYIINFYQKDGSIKWKAELETDFNIQTERFVTDGEILFASHAKDLRAWDINTGEQKWIVKMEHEWGNFVDDQAAYWGGMFFQSGYDLYCLDAESGEIIYRKDTPSNDITIYEDKLYSDYFRSTYPPPSGIEQRNGILVCADPATGETIWEQAINDGTDEDGGGMIYMPPICEDGIVYVGSDEHNPSGVQAFNAETGEEIWHTQIKGTALFSDGVIVDDMLVMNAGYNHIVGLNKHTGDVQYIKFVSQVLVWDRLHYYKGYIYTARQGWLHVIDPYTGEKVFKTHGGEGRDIVRVSVGNDRVFCHGFSSLLCLDIYRPEEDQ
jgi:outer membrane protein assembly factor BamB